MTCTSLTPSVKLSSPLILHVEHLISTQMVTTLQAGVRGLSRSLAAICRHVAVQIVSQEDARLQDDLPHRSRSTANLQDSAHPDQLMPYSVSASNVTQHQHSRQHTGPSADFLNSPSTSAGSAHQVSFSMTGQHTEFGTGESQATASGGGLSWGTLWGGLKGALGPTRAHTVDRQTHASTSKQQHSHQSQHESPASSEQLQQQLPLSNPYGGMNADLDAPEQPALPCITVTAELIEEVLGPRKYNELDSADSLMSPGMFPPPQHCDIACTDHLTCSGAA